MSPRSRAAWLLSQACQVSAASSSMPNLFFATAPAQLIRLGERGGPTTQWMALQEQGIAAGIYQSPMRAAISTLKDSARSFHSSSSAYHGGGGSTPGAETISVTFIDKQGKEATVQAPIGKNLLEVAHDNEIDLEGACEGSLACSTCHLIVENEEYYKRLPEPSEDELDMLDLAFGLTETSRLGCQIIASKELDGVRVRIPAASRNFYVDGHRPQPH